MDVIQLQPALAARVRELEAALADTRVALVATEKERVHHAQAWSDAQREIIRLKAEVARLVGRRQ